MTAGAAMNDVIAEYKKWKQQGEDLRTQARAAIEARFRELMAEAVQLAEEYRADFSAPLKPPANVTAFRYKSGGKGKARKAAKPAGTPAPKVEAPPAKPNPKVAGLEKKLATAKKKLEAAKASGAATRLLEDRVYELEDELRLSAQA